ncbi:MAG: glycosyltransferase [Rhodospirillales bacterium]|nr:glycosyltransferase [Rhodospirillales bacterium]
MSAPPTVLVYRDRIVPPSEAQFMRRQYLGFTRLAPVWVGTRTDRGLEALGVQPVILGGPVARALFKLCGRVPGLERLRGLNPRIVHAQFGRGGALALPIARALGVPLVVTFHGGDATKQTHYRRRLIPTLYQRRLPALQREAAAFVCVSDFIRDTLLARGFPAEKLVVLRNGVDLPPEDPASPATEGPPGAHPASADRPSDAASSDPPYLLFVGRLVPKKGLGDLLAALARLGEAAPALMVIGEGPEEATLRAQASDRVRFLGWQDNRAVRRWMRGALALCVPSVTAASGDSEGLPTVAIEAMSEGVPVIGTRHAGIVEAVVDGETGLLVPQADPAALAAAIATLCADPARRHAMGAAGRRRVRADFDAMTQSRKLEDLLLSLAR